MWRIKKRGKKELRHQKQEEAIKLSLFLTISYHQMIYMLFKSLF